MKTYRINYRAADGKSKTTYVEAKVIDDAITKFREEHGDCEIVSHERVQHNKMFVEPVPTRHFFTDNFGWNHVVELRESKYYEDGPKLELVEILPRPGEEEPFLTATVYRPDENLEEDEIIIKNYAENKGVLEFLIRNKVVSLPVRTIRNGYISLDVVKYLGIK